ncbi:hypothetical protein R3P38DRAFT_2804741 [Favolaschia claudopus]|uniref:Uncharacterized protein n=1 Tax=Favolaschia claudopus TaxID=2862362 RepID=A0AAV9ZPL6_9AGAR
MPKRKERPTGLKKGTEHGSCAKITKKSKAKKENITVYVASLESGSESEPDSAFSSLPVHGTLSRPHKLKKKTHRLRPLDTDEDSETLPDLEAVSDDKDEDDEPGTQADNEEDDKGPDDDFEDLRADWDHQSYAEAWKSFGVDKEATGSSPDTFSRPVATTDDDQEMLYEPYSQFRPKCCSRYPNQIIVTLSCAALLPLSLTHISEDFKVRALWLLDNGYVTEERIMRREYILRLLLSGGIARQRHGVLLVHAQEDHSELTDARPFPAAIVKFKLNCSFRDFEGDRTQDMILKLGTAQRHCNTLTVQMPIQQWTDEQENEMTDDEHTKLTRHLSYVATRSQENQKAN